MYLYLCVGHENCMSAVRGVYAMCEIVCCLFISFAGQLLIGCGVGVATPQIVTTSF